jgi:hypothetical protein
MHERVAQGNAKTREANALGASVPATSQYFPERNLPCLKNSSQSHTPNNPSHDSSHILESTANMGFTDLVSDAGLTLLNNWVKTRSYIIG